MPSSPKPWSRTAAAASVVMPLFQWRFAIRKPISNSSRPSTSSNRLIPHTPANPSSLSTTAHIPTPHWE